MSVPTPTTAELTADIVSEIEAKISQTAPILPKAFIRVLAKVFAGVVFLLYKYADFVFLQLFESTATMRETTIAGKKRRPLVDLGRRNGAGDPNPATRAELSIGVNVKNTVGPDLAAGSQLLHVDTGQLYVTAFPVPLASAVPVTVDGVSILQLTVTVRATQEGSAGNRATGDRLSFAKPLSNVGTEARVLSTVTVGEDEEQPEAYRRRVILKGQRKPQGGAHADYWEWAREAEGIINAYPYSGNLPGEVDIYCEATVESAGNDDGFPTNDQLTDVFNHVSYIDGIPLGKPNRRPANAAINALSITRVAFNVVVTGLQPNTAETRQAITDAVDEFLRSREPYIEGLTALPRTDRVTEAAVGGVVNEIASARGATVNDVTISPGPAATLGRGEKAKLAADPTFA